MQKVLHVERSRWEKIRLVIQICHCHLIKCIHVTNVKPNSEFQFSSSCDLLYVQIFQWSPFQVKMLDFSLKKKKCVWLESNRVYWLFKFSQVFNWSVDQRKWGKYCWNCSTFTWEEYSEVHVERFQGQIQDFHLAGGTKHFVPTRTLRVWNGTRFWQGS